MKLKTDDTSLITAQQPDAPTPETPDAAQSPRRSLWKTWIADLLLFCFTGIYVELCLHLCVYHKLDRHTIYLILFALQAGVFFSLLTSFLPKILRQIVGVLLVAVQVLFAEVQLVYQCIFGNFMPISQVSMGENVITNFNSQIFYAIFKNLPRIILLLLPLIAVIACLALRKVPTLKLRLRWKQAQASFALLLVLVLVTVGLLFVGRNKPFSVYKTLSNVNTSTDSSYKKVGMIATTVQELHYMIAGDDGDITFFTPSTLEVSSDQQPYSSNSFNVIESIDFTKLAGSTDSAILKATDEYLAKITPSRKSNYTGLLKDYNLITICAESFCPWFISEELTPALYKMTHTGIIFKNYYGSFQSVTTNGEYTMCMGLYPDMSRTKTDSSFNVAGTNYLPFCLGNALNGMGYKSYGYHDYIGDFYNRNITHANMGYDFKAADSGLNVKIDWPSSDLEMIEASVNDYINSKEPFHAYYMTFSGHYQYNWDNAMSAKNKAAVEDLPYSEPVKAYIACNLELEYALQYLMQQLEEAGVADRTCIVLTNDHYPYGLTEAEYDELAEVYRLYVDSRFQLSSNIVNSDYYAHVFNKEPSGGSLKDTVVFTDIKSIFNQASVLYMYRNGYVDPESPDNFGGQSTAKLGEFVDVLYRIAGRPETDNSALPPDYESRSFNASYPYYDAVCWAYQTRILRQSDLLYTGYDEKMDYRGACMLIYRFAALAGINTNVDQSQLLQVMSDNSNLTREAAKAMLWCDEKDITTRDSDLDELLASSGTRISRYQMTSFLFYLCTYELNMGS